MPRVKSFSFTIPLYRTSKALHNVQWERIFSQRESTCLVVSHRKAVLQRADHIIIFKGGRIEAKGTLGVLLETCEEMQCLWHSNWENSEASEEA